MDLNEHLKRIAPLGGRATLEKHGIEHLRAIAKLGGAVMKEKGSEYFRRIRARRGIKQKQK